ncbi:hypothetical protein TRFO_23807 [Tritrichomonas foetus]|uniref:Integral membrane protein n=1 Tax=Tritrichomonas foetus TaxID=1144522 RepID=A0A1J4K9G0_9EUKA|nr:hypothetical protein TRFO_23807 [Tritrichomonas foetus]|eukprot:OHT07859.1 hypothetical protein TRFO_23807 [Tritrichomonas foetus]
MAKKPEVPNWQRITAIPGMLLFGTCTVVVQKFLFEQTAQGLDKYGVHKFKKPWFQTNSMFIGMFLALLVYEVQRLFESRKKKSQSLNGANSESVVSLSDNANEGHEQSSSHKKMYFYVAAPACCDLLATSLMNIGLLYINASVWQMLRGSMVLFSSIFCAFILKRPHYPYMWWSVVLITIALGVVGFAAVAATGVGKAGVSTGKVIMAIFLTVGSQLIQASQIVVEDFLMHDMTASPVLIVGLEGMWGTLFTCSIFLPMNQFAFTSLPEGEGLHEDTLDTFKMIGNSSILIVFVIAYVIVILLYNVMGMFVTNITSAVMRTILEGLRTLCIWVVQLCLYYGFEGHDYGNKHPDIGEEWTKWSWMQLSGFLLLFTGMLLYNRIIEVPIFNYPPVVKKNENEVIDDAPLIADEKE